jgi:cellulose biosynthesis protein BcsQ
MRVVAIDADFSTRGLSLYLLGDVLRNESLIIQEENCLADSILNGRPCEEISPVIITRESIRYPVVLSNRDLRRGGVPEERFLGGFPLKGDAAPASPSLYYHYLKALCDRFRKEYDYVIIDTRGGYDFTSAAPATIADGFITVIEADKISVEQVRGFLTKIDEFADSLDQLETEKIRAVHRGFIINKAIHSVDDRAFPEELFRLYEAKTFGVIPSDRSAIRAYQIKEIPAERSPDADFSYFSAKALTKLLAPEENWRRSENTERFKKFWSHIKDRWEGRKRVELLQQAIPTGLLALVTFAVGAYLLFKNQTSLYALPVFYGSLALFVLASIIGSMLSTLGLLRNKEASSRTLMSVAVAMLIACLGLGYLAFFDVRKTFSRDALLQRATQDAATIDSKLREISDLAKTKSTLESQVALLTADKQRAESEGQNLKSQLDQSQQSALNAQQQTAAAVAARSKAEDAYKNAQQQIANLQQQVASLQQRPIGPQGFDMKALKSLSYLNDKLLTSLKGGDCRGALDTVFSQKSIILSLENQAAGGSGR